MITVLEEDNSVYFHDTLGAKSFNIDTHDFGSNFVVSDGSESVVVTLDSGSYPSYKY